MNDDVGLVLVLAAVNALISLVLWRDLRRGFRGMRPRFLALCGALLLVYAVALVAASSGIRPFLGTTVLLLGASLAAASGTLAVLVRALRTPAKGPPWGVPRPPRIGEDGTPITIGIHVWGLNYNRKLAKDANGEYGTWWVHVIPLGATDPVTSYTGAITSFAGAADNEDGIREFEAEGVQAKVGDIVATRASLKVLEVSQPFVVEGLHFLAMAAGGGVIAGASDS